MVIVAIYQMLSSVSDLNYSLIRDTVSSIGVLRSQNLPETATGMSHVCKFRHALALDERRVKFLPEYACGGAGPSQPKLDPKKRFSDTKEVWFAGTQSDV